MRKINSKDQLSGDLTMSISKLRGLVCVALVISFAQAASAADVLVGDAKSQPESLTVAPGGVLIVGSASSTVNRRWFTSLSLHNRSERAGRPSSWPPQEFEVERCER
jgi:hypothetical protein